MLDRWRDARADKDQELDLIPVMNLMVTLIPFLLLGAAFYHLGVIPTSLPNNVSASDSPPATEIKVNLILAITATELALTGTVTGPDPDENETIKQTLKKTFPIQGKGKYDTVGLQVHLEGIKDKYPKSDTVLVKPEEQIKYEALVSILDAIRDKETKGLDKDGNPARKALFPVAVFTTLNKVLPDGGVEGDGGVEDAP